MRVHRDDALHHAVENGRGLGALLLEVVDLLAQPRHHRVESAAQSADLIHGAHRRARRILALAHAPRDRFHLDDGPRDAAGDEEADTRRHGEREQTAREEHAVDPGIRGRDDRQRQRQAEHADGARAVSHRQRHIKEGGTDGDATPQVAPDVAVERCADFGAVSMILEPRQLRLRHLGIGEDDPVGRDERDARAGRPGRAHDEVPQRARHRADEQPARFVVQQARGGDQAGLQRVHGERLEGAGEIDTRRARRDGDEADERERQLDGDTPANELERPGHRRIIASGRRRAGALR